MNTTTDWKGLVVSFILVHMVGIKRKLPQHALANVGGYNFVFLKVSFSYFEFVFIHYIHENKPNKKTFFSEVYILLRLERNIYKN